MAAITFDQLHDELSAAGIEVGVVVGDRGHAITLVDPDSLREIRYPVGTGGFDAAATTLVLSAWLREHLTPPAHLGRRSTAGGTVVAGTWPELEALAPAAP